MKGLKGTVLCGGLVLLVAGIVVLVLWRTLRARSNPSPANANTSLPIQRLRAFPLTNGPTGVASASWSTNHSIEPLKALVMQQVAAVARLNQPSNTPSRVVKITGNFRDSKQEEGLRRLQQRVGASLNVYLRTENNTPNQLKGSPLAEAVGGGDDPNTRNETTAKTFFRDNADLFLIDNPESELQLADRQADDLGGWILRFTQHYRGLTVWPAEIGVHFDTSGDVDLVDGAYVPTPNDIAIQPKLTVKDSEVKARRAVSGGANAAIQTPELVIYGPLDQSAKLAWKMEVSVALDQAWWVVIDAQNGDTLATISRVMNDSVSGSGVDLLGVSRSLNVWRSGPTYYMIDASKPMFNASTGYGFIETDDALNQSQSQIMSNNVLQNIYFATSDSSSLWVNSNAVSAAYNLSQTYDYYLDRFGRNSYNGSGSNIFAVVRIGGLLNAFWHDGFKRMFFGSADQFAASLDVIGHEVTHGVTFSIGSQGVLLNQDQSGALNEAFADVFGEMIEARTKGTNDWLLGSQLVGENLHRSMSNPPAYNQPATMSQYVVTTSDHGGVHVNNGIINHAYYLLAAGLKGAVGNRDAERIFYRCLTVSMKPFSQFIDARLGCVAAAEALFGVGSQQALKTAEAFDAVELYAAPASAPQPTNVNAAVSAPDSEMLVRSEQYWDWGTLSWRYQTNLCRIETGRGDSSTGSSLVTSVKLARPAISGNGEGMFFVGGDESLYGMQTMGTGFTNFNLTGLVHSVAVSPQGRYAAFVFNAAPNVPTNQIVILDLWSNLTSMRSEEHTSELQSHSFI